MRLLSLVPFVIFLLLSSSISSVTYSHFTFLTGPSRPASATASPTLLSSFATGSTNQSTNPLVSNCSYSRDNSEVESATDPTNGYVYGLWIGCNGIGFARSTDGGRTFEPPITIPGSLDLGGNSSWDPAIAVGNTGAVYAAYMLSKSNQGGVPYVAISYDHGTTFQEGLNVSTPSATEFSDRDFVAISPNGTIYVTWNYAPNASLVRVQCPSGGSCYYTTGDLNIVISHSSDEGKNWSSPVPISPNYPNGGGVSAPLLVEPSGRIDVLYEDYEIGANHTLGRGLNYFTYSNDGGATWASRVAVGNASGYLSNTEWWIDGDLSRDKSGTLYASYDTPNGTSENAWLAISSDGGINWSRPVELSRGDSSTLNIMPGVLGAGDSSVYTAWMADYPSGWSTFFQAFSNTGEALSRQIVVSNLSGINGIWGGDTLGIAGLDNGAAVTWGYGVRSPGGQNLSEIFSSNVYNVTLLSSGGGTTNPGGSNWFRSGSIVTIQAFSDSDSAFEGWVSASLSLVALNSSSPDTFLTVYGGGSVTAKFSAVSLTTGASSSSTASQNSLTNTGPPSSSSVPYDWLALIGVLIITVSVIVIVRRSTRQRRGP